MVADDVRGKFGDAFLSGRSGGVGDFLMAAVIKAETDRTCGAIFSQFFCLVDNTEGFFTETITRSEKDNFDVFSVEFVGFFFEVINEEIHEISDFLDWAMPVFGGKNIESSEFYT